MTLFLSIEVSKAMLHVSKAKALGDAENERYYQQMVDIFTDQLNESNPILTEISDAMTEEGNAIDQWKRAVTHGDKVTATRWQHRVNDASAAKIAGNEKLMACSTKYMNQMKMLRLQATVAQPRITSK